MTPPTDLATPLDAPVPRGLLRARLTADGAQLAGDDESPPQRYPAGEVRRALTTPPPVRFRKHLPEPMPPLDLADDELTEDSVRQAFTFGIEEPEFSELGVEDYGWAPRRQDHGLFYGLDDTLAPAEPRVQAPESSPTSVIWLAALVGLLGGMALAAWS
ncbi:MAG: hypothetical protein EP330_05645 [Deltaproteobacteria bacterium]|nr:MAG: hypothetical protein EP330_05645 [Deltaproteobacteria bacterium]